MVSALNNLKRNCTNSRWNMREMRTHVRTYVFIFQEAILINFFPAHFWLKTESNFWKFSIEDWKPSPSLRSLIWWHLGVILLYIDNLGTPCHPRFCTRFQYWFFFYFTMAVAKVDTKPPKFNPTTIAHFTEQNSPLCVPS